MPATSTQDQKAPTVSTAAPATSVSKSSSDCESSAWTSASQSEFAPQKEAEAVLRARRLAAIGHVQKPLPEQPDASVTSDPDSDTNSVAPNQLGESSLPSKRSNTRTNKSKGPAYLKRKLERAIKHNLDAGTGPPEGEQLANAEKFTGLKGDQAMAA